MDAKAVRRAQDKLELRDIALHTSSLERSLDVEPLLYPTRVHQKSEVKVSVDRVSFVDDEDDTVRILRAYVQLLLYALDRADKNKKSQELFSVKGEYRVDYLEKKELTQKELDAFTQFNAVHNVWPFWRQHVYETIAMASLPRITLPFFRAIPGVPKAKRTARRPLAAQKWI